MSAQTPQAASTPRWIGAKELAQALPYSASIDVLEAAFKGDVPDGQPSRSRMEVARGELLLMPAHSDDSVGVKLVTLNPANPARDLPLIHGLYVLFHDTTLAPEVIIDGAALTAVRTASVSALATRYLARHEARRLVVFGTGAQAVAHVAAMRAVRPIEHVSIVGKDLPRTQQLVDDLRRDGLQADAAEAEAVTAADIVCTCTTSADPLFPGRLVPPGAHVNAVGAHRPDERELDGELLGRAVVVVETLQAALAEAGDLLLAIGEGFITESSVAGALADVVQGRVTRSGPDTITVFKSVGLAIEDLVLARAAAARVQ